MTGRTRAAVSTNVCAGCGILTSTNECSRRSVNCPGDGPRVLGGLMDETHVIPFLPGGASWQ